MPLGRQRDSVLKELRDRVDRVEEAAAKATADAESARQTASRSPSPPSLSETVSAATLRALRGRIATLESHLNAAREDASLKAKELSAVVARLDKMEQRERRRRDALPQAVVGRLSDNGAGFSDSSEGDAQKEDKTMLLKLAARLDGAESRLEEVARTLAGKANVADVRRLKARPPTPLLPEPSLDKLPVATKTRCLVCHQYTPDPALSDWPARPASAAHYSVDMSQAAGARLRLAPERGSRAGSPSRAHRQAPLDLSLRPRSAAPARAF